MALCHEEDQTNVADALLNNSSTIGLRILPFEKRVLPRQETVISTSLGDVRVKQVTQPNGQVRWKSEHEDVAVLADQHQRDYHSTKQLIDSEIRKQLS